MFKNNNFENEIYKSMEKKLSSKQLEDTYNFNKIERAINYLSYAASIFDKAGMYSEASEVTEILGNLSKQLSS